MFWNLIKTTCGHVFNVNSDSHQTDVPYKNGTRNLRRKDVCAPGKELPHHLQLKRSKEFETSTSGAQGSQSEQLVVNNRFASDEKTPAYDTYKLRLLQHLKDTNKPAREDFCNQDVGKRRI